MMTLPLTRHPALTGFILLILFFSLPLEAQTVREKLPSGRYGIAAYHQAETAKPAILVLHGFLTTHNFNTVMSISELLAENGHTVLAPTMTLGINARQGGLACDAIHTHTMEDDLAEISFWVNWLSKHGHQQIILIGHSSGSMELLAYLNNNPNPAVSKLIATSLVYADGFNSTEVVNQQIVDARKKTATARSFSPELHLLLLSRQFPCSCLCVFVLYRLVTGASIKCPGKQSRHGKHHHGR